ncbi:uncharacterized protein [Clytia hemisphaerica]|uniref:uncharacterized protein isoform X3 n=1 Tax=Clytia hemisphaerica TaxID=252671 RepID=UPI0034D51686
MESKLLFLSPNEEASHIKRKFEMKRLERLVQVREQEKASSQKMRKEYVQCKVKSINEATYKKKSDQEKEQKAKEIILLVELERRMKALGEAHNLQGKENHGVKKALTADEELHIVERTRLAYKKLQEQQEEHIAMLDKEKALREKIHQMETDRKDNIISQPKPDYDPIQELQPVKLVASTSKLTMESFSTTRFHMGQTLIDGRSYPEVFIEKPGAHDQINAKEAAIEEFERFQMQTEMRENEVHERNEKANLRHHYARNEVILQQAKQTMMVELEDLELRDRQRRSQLVAEIPKKIFQPPYQRQKDAKLRQYELEQAFERVHAVKCDDPMERYYKNADSIIEDIEDVMATDNTLHDEVKTLEIPTKENDQRRHSISMEEELQKELNNNDNRFTTKQPVEMQSQASITSQSNSTKLERLRNKIRDQQKQKHVTISSKAPQEYDAEESTDIDSASVVLQNQQTNKTTTDRKDLSINDSKRHESLRSLQSMNIESAICESDSSKSQEKTSVFDDVPEKTTISEDMEQLPRITVPSQQNLANNQQTSQQTNPLTQQNLEYNQRLLEHQKRVAELQKRHLANKMTNQQLITEAQRIQAPHVNVYLPQAMGADSPSTIVTVAVSTGSPGLESMPDGSLPIPDTSMRQVKPDSELEVSTLNSNQTASSRNRSSNVSPTISRICSSSLRQYPLTGESTTSPGCDTSTQTVTEESNISTQTTVSEDVDSATQTHQLKQHSTKTQTKFNVNFKGHKASTQTPISEEANTGTQTQHSEDAESATQTDNSEYNSSSTQTKMKQHRASTQTRVKEHTNSTQTSHHELEIATQTSFTDIQNQLEVAEETQGLSERALEREESKKHRSKSPTRNKSSKTDQQKIQKKQHELRQQYPEIFTNPEEPEQQSSMTGKGSKDTLNRLKSVRSDLQKQREDLEIRRSKRAMEAAEETMRNSAVSLSRASSHAVNSAAPVLDEGVLQVHSKVGSTRSKIKETKSSTRRNNKDEAIAGVASIPSSSKIKMASPKSPRRVEELKKEGSRLRSKSAERKLEAAESTESTKEHSHRSHRKHKDGHTSKHSSEISGQSSAQLLSEGSATGKKKDSRKDHKRKKSTNEHQLSEFGKGTTRSSTRRTGQKSSIGFTESDIVKLTGNKDLQLPTTLREEENLSDESCISISFDVPEEFKRKKSTSKRNDAEVSESSRKKKSSPRSSRRHDVDSAMSLASNAEISGSSVKKKSSPKSSRRYDIDNAMSLASNAEVNEPSMKKKSSPKSSRKHDIDSAMSLASNAEISGSSVKKKSSPKSSRRYDIDNAMSLASNAEVNEPSMKKKSSPKSSRKHDIDSAMSLASNAEIPGSSIKKKSSPRSSRKHDIDSAMSLTSNAEITGSSMKKKSSPKSSRRHDIDNAMSLASNAEVNEPSMKKKSSPKSSRKHDIDSAMSLALNAEIPGSSKTKKSSPKSSRRHDVDSAMSLASNAEITGSSIKNKSSPRSSRRHDIDNAMSLASNPEVSEPSMKKKSSPRSSRKHDVDNAMSLTSSAEVNEPSTKKKSSPKSSRRHDIDSSLSLASNAEIPGPSKTKKSSPKSSRRHDVESTMSLASNAEVSEPSIKKKSSPRSPRRHDIDNAMSLTSSAEVNEPSTKKKSSPKSSRRHDIDSSLSLASNAEIPGPSKTKKSSPKSSRRHDVESTMSLASNAEVSEPSMKKKSSPKSSRRHDVESTMSLASNAEVSEPSMKKKSSPKSSRRHDIDSAISLVSNAEISASSKTKKSHKNVPIVEGIVTESSLALSAEPSTPGLSKSKKTSPESLRRVHELKRHGTKSRSKVTDEESEIHQISKDSSHKSLHQGSDGKKTSQSIAALPAFSTTEANTSSLIVEHGSPDIVQCTDMSNVAVVLTADSKHRHEISPKNSHRIREYDRSHTSHDSLSRHSKSKHSPKSQHKMDDHKSKNTHSTATLNPSKHGTHSTATLNPNKHGTHSTATLSPSNHTVKPGQQSAMLLSPNSIVIGKSRSNVKSGNSTHGLKKKSALILQKVKDNKTVAKDNELSPKGSSRMKEIQRKDVAGHSHHSFDSLHQNFSHRIGEPSDNVVDSMPIFMIEAVESASKENERSPRKKGSHTRTSRSHTGDSRSHTGGSQSHALNSRSHTGNSRSHTGSSRSHTGSSRSHTGSSRSHTGSSRSHTGSSRSHTSRSHTGSSRSHTGGSRSRKESRRALDPYQSKKELSKGSDKDDSSIDFTVSASVGGPVQSDANKVTSRNSFYIDRKHTRSSTSATRSVINGVRSIPAVDEILNELHDLQNQIQSHQQVDQLLQQGVSSSSHQLASQGKLSQSSNQQSSAHLINSISRNSILGHPTPTVEIYSRIDASTSNQSIIHFPSIAQLHSSVNNSDIPIDSGNHGRSPSPSLVEAVLSQDLTCMSPLSNLKLHSNANSSQLENSLGNLQLDSSLSNSQLDNSLRNSQLNHSRGSSKNEHSVSDSLHHNSLSDLASDNSLSNSQLEQSLSDSQLNNSLGNSQSQHSVNSQSQHSVNSQSQHSINSQSQHSVNSQSQHSVNSQLENSLSNSQHDNSLSNLQLDSSLSNSQVDPNLERRSSSLSNSFSEDNSDIADSNSQLGNATSNYKQHSPRASHGQVQPNRSNLNFDSQMQQRCPSPSLLDAVLSKDITSMDALNNQQSHPNHSHPNHSYSQFDNSTNNMQFNPRFSNVQVDSSRSNSDVKQSNQQSHPNHSHPNHSYSQLGDAQSNSLFNPRFSNVQVDPRRSNLDFNQSANLDPQLHQRCPSPSLLDAVISKHIPSMNALSNQQVHPKQSYSQLGDAASRMNGLSNQQIHSNQGYSQLDFGADIAQLDQSRNNLDGNHSVNIGNSQLDNFMSNSQLDLGYQRRGQNPSLLNANPVTSKGSSMHGASQSKVHLGASTVQLDPRASNLQSNNPVSDSNLNPQMQERCPSPSLLDAVLSKDIPSMNALSNLQLHSGVSNSQLDNSASNSQLDPGYQRQSQNPSLLNANSVTSKGSSMHGASQSKVHLDASTVQLDPSASNLQSNNPTTRASHGQFGSNLHFDRSVSNSNLDPQMQQRCPSPSLLDAVISQHIPSMNALGNQQSHPNHSYSQFDNSTNNMQFNPRFSNVQVDPSRSNFDVNGSESLDPQMQQRCPSPSLLDAVLSNNIASMNALSNLQLHSDINNSQLDNSISNSHNPHLHNMDPNASSLGVAISNELRMHVPSNSQFDQTFSDSEVDPELITVSDLSHSDDPSNGEIQMNTKSNTKLGPGFEEDTKSSHRVASHSRHNRSHSPSNSKLDPRLEHGSKSSHRDKSHSRHNGRHSPSNLQLGQDVEVESRSSHRIKSHSKIRDHSPSNSKLEPRLEHASKSSHRVKSPSRHNGRHSPSNLQLGQNLEEGSKSTHRIKSHSRHDGRHSPSNLQLGQDLEEGSKSTHRVKSHSRHDGRHSPSNLQLGQYLEEGSKSTHRVKSHSRHDGRHSPSNLQLGQDLEEGSKSTHRVKRHSRHDGRHSPSNLQSGKDLEEGSKSTHRVKRHSSHDGRHSPSNLQSDQDLGEGSKSSHRVKRHSSHDGRHSPSNLQSDQDLEEGSKSSHRVKRHSSHDGRHSPSNLQSDQDLEDGSKSSHRVKRHSSHDGRHSPSTLQSDQDLEEGSKSSHRVKRHSSHDGRHSPSNLQSDQDLEEGSKSTHRVKRHSSHDGRHSPSNLQSDQDLEEGSKSSHRVKRHSSHDGRHSPSNLQSDQDLEEGSKSTHRVKRHSSHDGRLSPSTLQSDQDLEEGSKSSHRVKSHSRHDGRHSPSNLQLEQYLEEGSKSTHRVKRHSRHDGRHSPSNLQLGQDLEEGSKSTHRVKRHSRHDGRHSPSNLQSGKDLEDGSKSTHRVKRHSSHDGRHSSSNLQSDQDLEEGSKSTHRVKRHSSHDGRHSPSTLQSDQDLEEGSKSSHRVKRHSSHDGRHSPSNLQSDQDLEEGSKSSHRVKRHSSHDGRHSLSNLQSDQDLKEGSKSTHRVKRHSSHDGRHSPSNLQLVQDLEEGSKSTHRVKSHSKKCRADSPSNSKLGASFREDTKSSHRVKSHSKHSRSPSPTNSQLNSNDSSSVQIGSSFEDGFTMNVPGNSGLRNSQLISELEVDSNQSDFDDSASEDIHIDVPSKFQVGLESRSHHASKKSRTHVQSNLQLSPDHKTTSKTSHLDASHSHQNRSHSPSNSQLDPRHQRKSKSSHIDTAPSGHSRMEVTGNSQLSQDHEKKRSHLDTSHSRHVPSNSQLDPHHQRKSKSSHIDTAPSGHSRMEVAGNSQLSQDHEKKRSHLDTSHSRHVPSNSQLQRKSKSSHIHSTLSSQSKTQMSSNVQLSPDHETKNSHLDASHSRQNRVHSPSNLQLDSQLQRKSKSSHMHTAPSTQCAILAPSSNQLSPNLKRKSKTSHLNTSHSNHSRMQGSTDNQLCPESLKRKSKISQVNVSHSRQASSIQQLDSGEPQLQRTSKSSHIDTALSKKSRSHVTNNSHLNADFLERARKSSHLHTLASRQRVEATSSRSTSPETLDDLLGRLSPHSIEALMNKTREELSESILTSNSMLQSGSSGLKSLSSTEREFNEGGPIPSYNNVNDPQTQSSPSLEQWKQSLLDSQLSDHWLFSSKPYPQNENDYDDDVPVLSSDNLNGGASGIHKVSENPLVSPIKEVDENLINTPYSKHNSMGSLQEQTLSAGSRLGSHVSSGYSQNGLSLTRQSGSNQSEDDTPPRLSNHSAGVIESANQSATLIGNERLHQYDNSEEEMQRFLELNETFRNSRKSMDDTLILDNHYSSNDMLPELAADSDYFMAMGSSQLHQDSSIIFQQSPISFHSPQARSFQNLRPVQASPGADANTESSMTVDEILQNNRHILEDMSKSNSGSGTSDSLKSYHALLEHVKRLPLIHAREQQDFINSFNINNMPPNNQFKPPNQQNGKRSPQGGTRSPQPQRPTSPGLLGYNTAGQFGFPDGKRASTNRKQKQLEAQALSNLGSPGKQGSSKESPGKVDPPSAQLPRSPGPAKPILRHSNHSGNNQYSPRSQGSGSFQPVPQKHRSSHNIPGPSGYTKSPESRNLDNNDLDVDSMSSFHPEPLISSTAISSSINTQTPQHHLQGYKSGNNDQNHNLQSDSYFVQSGMRMSRFSQEDSAIHHQNLAALAELESDTSLDNSLHQFDRYYNPDSSTNGHEMMGASQVSQEVNQVSFRRITRDEPKTEMHPQFSGVVNNVTNSNEPMTSATQYQRDGHPTDLDSHFSSIAINAEHSNNNVTPNDDRHFEEEDLAEQPITPSPIVFTGGAPISSVQSNSSGELQESDLDGQLYQQRKHHNEFVMSYFHDTSPEMLSFTKTIQSQSDGGGDSNSEFLSLTQGSYMPLPEPGDPTNENASNLNAHQSATRELTRDQILTNQYPSTQHTIQSEDVSLHTHPINMFDSDIPTLSLTATSSKHQQPNYQDHQNTSGIQTLSYTASKQSPGPSSTKAKDSSDVQTLSFTASRKSASPNPRNHPSSIQTPTQTTSQSKPNNRHGSDIPTLSKVATEDIPNSQKTTPTNKSQSSNSITPSSKDRNTLSLLTSDRTISELANLRSSSSPCRLGNQGNSPDATKDTMDLINQLAHSSNLQQHSDTESSELFTVGRLSLDNIEQSRSNIALNPEGKSDLSMLSDLNLSSMSENSLNWTSLVPSRTAPNLNQDLKTECQPNVRGAVSLQDAFLQSNKKFISRSKDRKKEVENAALRQYESKQKAMKSKVQTNLKRNTSKDHIPNESSGISLSATSGASTSSGSGKEKMDKVKRKESVLETKQRTKRLYDRLPEVQRQAAEKQRQEAGQRNREKAQKFHEKLQQHLKKKQEKKH